MKSLAATLIAAIALSATALTANLTGEGPTLAERSPIIDTATVPLPPRRPQV